MSLQNLKELKNEKILIDSCVLIYCGDDALQDQTKQILRALEDNGNSLSISELCLFEVLKNIFNHKNFEYYTSLLIYLSRIPVLVPHLTNAAKIGRLYIDGKKASEDKHEQGKKGAHTGDLIIGGSAVFHNALVLTCDKSEGFNWLHWEPVAKAVLTYEHSYETKVINMYALRFRQQSSLPDGFLTTENHTGVVSLSKVKGVASHTTTIKEETKN